MKTVKVGTRLTLVLLLALTPVVAIYTYWSVARPTRTYIDDLKRETRASTRALVPAVENDLRVDERDQIYDVLIAIEQRAQRSIPAHPPGWRNPVSRMS